MSPAAPDFLASLSQQIGPPAQGIIGLTDLLLATDLDDHQRRLVQAVRDSGEVLLGIIGDTGRFAPEGELVVDPDFFAALRAL